MNTRLPHRRSSTPEQRRAQPDLAGQARPQRRSSQKAKFKALASAPRPPGADADRAQIRIVYRGYEMVGEVAIRPLLGLGTASEDGP